MNQSDEGNFGKLLLATMEVYGVRLSKNVVSIWWEALKDYDFPQVRQALSLHIKDPDKGHFAPKPADVIAKIPNGHPSPEEAWSKVMHALGDERATLVLTEPMKKAFLTADALAEDRIAARMAFLEVYRRELATAGPVKWVALLGHDPEQRESVLTEAVNQGLLAAPYAQMLLPHLPSEVIDKRIDKLLAKV